MNLKRQLYIALCLSLPFATAAKERRVHWGIAAASAAKFQLMPGKGTGYAPMGNWGLCITNVINGQDETALSFTHRTGFYRDDIAYIPVKGARFIIENINFIVNPEVLFPTKYERLHLTAGFGLDWLSVANVSYRNSGNNSITTVFEAAADTAIRAQKKLVPFVNIGLRLRVGTRGYLNCYVRQNLQNSIEGVPTIYLGTTTRPLPITLFHQPTYVGVAISYYLN